MEYPGAIRGGFAIFTWSTQTAALKRRKTGKTFFDAICAPIKFFQKSKKLFCSALAIETRRGHIHAVPTIASRANPRRESPELPRLSIFGATYKSEVKNFIEKIFWFPAGAPTTRLCCTLEHNLDAAHLEADHAVLVNGPNGRLYLVVDASGTAGYQSGADLQLKDAVHTEAIDTGSFI